MSLRSKIRRIPEPIIKVTDPDGNWDLITEIVFLELRCQIKANREEGWKFSLSEGNTYKINPNGSIVIPKTRDNFFKLREKFKKNLKDIKKDL